MTSRIPVTPHFLITCLALVLLTMGAYAQKPTLTIDAIEGDRGVITIHYTTTDPRGANLVTINWEYSIDGGSTWLDVNAAAISNNDPKPPGRSTIQWDTTKGSNNLDNQFRSTILFQMQVQDGGWRTVAPMLTSRWGLAAAVVDGKIYAIGGLSGPTPTVETYDPATNTWRTVAPMPTARSGLAAAVVAGKIYAIGGWDGSSYLSTVEVYDPATDTWRPIVEMPTARSWCAAAVVDGKIYVIGGTNRDRLLSTVEAYDPVTNRWQRMADRRGSGLAAVVLDGKVYAIGGAMFGNEVRSSDVDMYDPATNRWRRVAEMATPRSSLAAAVVDGKIYAIGGYDGNRTPSTVEVYDPAIDRWQMVYSMPTARSGVAAAVVNGKIYVVGDRSTVDVFTPPRFAPSEVAVSDRFTLDNSNLKVTVAVEYQSPFADGRASSKIHVIVLNLNNELVTSETVTLSTTLGTVTSTAKYENGTYVGTFTAGTKAGTARITAITSTGKSETVTITLKPQILSPTLSALVTDKEQIVADGVDKAVLEIRVRDSRDKPAPDKSATLSVTGTGNTIAPQTVLTNADGIATFEIRSTKAEIKTVTAAVGDEQIKLEDSVTLHFVPGPVAKVSLSANPTTLWADAKSQSKLTIAVFDTADNPIRDLNPGVSISPELGEVSGITIDGDGTYTATYTAPENIEQITPVTVTASIAGKSDSVVLSIRHAEITIIEISPPLIKIGERATILGSMFPKIPTRLILTFTRGEASTTEPIDANPDGTFKHFFTPNRAGDWQVVAEWAGDAKHKPVQSEPKTFTVQKAEPTITLQPPADLFGLSVGDTVTVEGEITPNPGVVDLEVVITDPDGVEKSEPIQTDDSGAYQHQFKTDQAGTWKVEVRFAGDDDYLPKQVSRDLSIGSQLGRAIIVAGGPERIENNTLWEITRQLCNNIYKTLRGRGYSRQMIHYLSPTPFEDVNGDGRNDISDRPTVENLRKAITQLPFAFFKRNPNAQLVVYLTGHGFEDRFQLADEREIVTANQINQWLDVLQRQTGLKKIIVIIDASRSGSFIDDLATEGRTIITSTDASRTVNFGHDGRESFSQFFFQRLALGHSVAKSFQLAEEAFVGLKPPYDLRPQLEGDGDGVPNGDIDRAIADQLHVGLDIKPGTTIPVIEQVTPPQEIGDTKTAQIWAEVHTVQDVQEVWAVIIPPNYQPPDKSDGSSRIELPIIFLTLSGDGKRYEGVYDGFSRPGEYTVIVYAEDRVGNVSAPKQTSVTVRMTVASLLPITLGKVKTGLLLIYPNPANPETWIPYQLASDAEVTLTIYDVSGKVVRRLELGHQTAGSYRTRDRAAYWDGRNDYSERVSSGIYFVRLEAGDFVQTRRLVLVK